MALLEVPGLEAQEIPRVGGPEFDFDAAVSSPEAYAAHIAPRITAWRAELERQRADLFARIRRVDGLHDFARAPSEDELLAQVGDGPVVLITVSVHGAYATIVAAGSLRVVPLPGVTPDTVADRVERMLRATAATSGVSVPERRQAERELGELLGWLWDRVAGRVLETLGITGSRAADGRLPRIWWCPTGHLALLPVHAAGHHHLSSGAVPATVMDRVVSSYTPTLRALHHARAARARTSSAPDDGRRGALVVAMPDTPGIDAASLPGTLAEATRVQSLVYGSRLLTGSDATFKAVTEALEAHRVAHFACHGLNDQSNPDASMLLLHDHADRPLTVSALGRRELREVDLAYLSACSTTRSSQWLADEALHITSAFQLAGYPHVIGTLWPVNDAVATRVAEDVYTDLTESGRTAPQPDLAPHALHEAVRRLRDDYVASPTLWAAHVHAGV